MTQTSKLPVMTVSLLIAGNTIGAGILGLPVKAGMAGMVPALTGMALAWGLMLMTGWIIVHRMLQAASPDTDLTSLFENELGKWAKWTTAAGYLVVFYGLLVAYLAAGSSVLGNLLGLIEYQKLLLVAFFLITAGLSIFGMGLVRKANAMLMVAIGLSFLALLYLAGKNAQATRLVYFDWAFLPSAMPVIVCAFTFQNTIPTACRSLEMNRRAVFTAILVGTSIPMVLNVAWTLVVVGALPLQSGSGNLAEAFMQNQPATVPLAAALQSETVITAGMVFSICALLTSYLAIAAALTGFLKDLLSPWLSHKKPFTYNALTLIPPLVVAFLYPNLFLSMLDIVGGVGILLIFGVLPCLVVVKSGPRTSKLLKTATWFVLGIFVLLMGLEILQETGCLRLEPRAEYWLLHHVSQPPSL